MGKHALAQGRHGVSRALLDRLEVDVERVELTFCLMGRAYMYRLVLEYSRILSVGEDEVDCELRPLSRMSSCFVLTRWILTQTST